MKSIKLTLVISSLLLGLQTVGAETKSGDAIGPMYVKGGRSIIDPHPTASKHGIIAPMYLKGSRSAIGPMYLKGQRKKTSPVDLKGVRSITTPSMINRSGRSSLACAVGPCCLVRTSR